MPTSTAAPTPTPNVTSLPEVVEGRALIEAGNFEQGMVLLRRAYSSDRNSETLQSVLAEAYLIWGRDIVMRADGAPELISDAAEKFTLGLNVAPENDNIRDDLLWEQQVAQGYLQGLMGLEEVRLLREEEANLQLQKDKINLVMDEFETTWDIHWAYPRLRESYIETLLLAAQIYGELSSIQETRADEISFCEDMMNICERGQEIALAESNNTQEFGRCIEQADVCINPPPTPEPEPDTPSGPDTPPPLVQIPNVRGADVGQARAFLQQSGFEVAVTAANVGDVCNAQVSYSSPPGGEWRPSGSLVRLFYRDPTLPNPAWCQ